MRKRLATLAGWAAERVGPLGSRPCAGWGAATGRAPAREPGLGEIGKGAMLLTPRAGSLIFLGALYVDLPLPIDAPFEEEHCGSCSACRTACPTGAIVDDKVVDARACISYLTIELFGAIPERYREAMGNRVFGCDDCQLVCPFTRFTRPTAEADFAPRHDLDRASLVSLFAWSEEEFLDKTAGSPIRSEEHTSEL